MAASIVLISDGTDPGTSQKPSRATMLRAADAGVPHPYAVIWRIRRWGGAGTGPRLHARSGDRLARRGPPNWPTPIPEHRLGTHRRAATISWIRYTVPRAAGGTVPVEVSLLNNRDTKATTGGHDLPAAPNVVIDLPRESRNLTVPNLDEPVELQLSAGVSRLDGQERG